MKESIESRGMETQTSFKARSAPSRSDSQRQIALTPRLQKKKKWNQNEQKKQGSLREEKQKMKIKHECHERRPVNVRKRNQVRRAVLMVKVK